MKPRYNPLLWEKSFCDSGFFFFSEGDVLNIISDKVICCAGEEKNTGRGKLLFFPPVKRE